MVDVDEQLPIPDAVSRLAEALVTGAIRGDDAIEFAPGLGRFEQFVGVEKCQLARHDVLVPDGDVLAGIFEGVGETELGTDAVAAGSNVANDAEVSAVTNRLHDP